MANLDWSRNKHATKPKERAFAPKKQRKGAQTHVRREPVKKFTDEEIEAWKVASGFDPQPGGEPPRPTQSASPARAAAIEMIARSNPAFFITLAFNRETKPEAAERKLREFHRRLDRAVLGRTWATERVGERSSYITAVEHVTSNLHLHMALACGERHIEKVPEIAAKIWTELVPSGSADVQRVYDAEGLGDYITKELKSASPDQLLLSDSHAS